jgi:hypothetical protein
MMNFAATMSHTEITKRGQIIRHDVFRIAKKMAVLWQAGPQVRDWARSMAWNMAFRRRFRWTA